jgi:hypothetical protein
MRKSATILTALAFLFLPLILIAQEEQYDGSSFARLTYVQGNVSVERAQDLGVEEGVVNLALVEGDRLNTGDGRAEVNIGRKNYLRLDRGSQVEFSNLPRRGDNRTRLHLLSGRVYLRVGFLEEEKTLELHTPDASFYILEAGLFRFEVRENAETELQVLEGSLEAAGESGSQLIDSREQLIASNGHLGAETTLSYGRDDFDHWNSERDSLHGQYVSKRYLPAEFADYEYELASNGYWAYERPYGYVWVPHVYYTDWRPYYYGRWVWYPVCGWTWVSSEPWGWCVYHYGRWHWRLGLGWYWIPHRHWGPAWVHWYSGYNYIGWCPLSWYNRPVVIVNNYFYDRYQRPHYPGASRALTVVRKNQLQNPNISRVALSRSESSRLGQITLQARQPSVAPVVKRGSLGKASPSAVTSRSPLKPSGKGQVSPATASPSRVSRSPSSSPTRDSLAPNSRGQTSARSLSPGNLSRSRSVSGYPSSGSPARSSRNSSSAVSSTPRKIGPETRSVDKPSSSSVRSGIRSYAASPGTTSPAKQKSLERKSSARIYTPSSSITRYGRSSTYPSTVSPTRGATSFGGSRIKEYRPSNSGVVSPSRSLPRNDSPLRSFSSPSVTRRNYSSRSSSISSRPRSVFSPPQVASPSRRSGSPSFSRPSSSFSSSPRSAPSRSASPSRSRSASSSRGASGRVTKRNN